MTNPRHDHLEGPPMTPTKKQPSALAEYVAVVILSIAAAVALLVFAAVTVAMFADPNMPTLTRAALGFINGTIAYRAVRWSIRTLKDAA